MRGPEPVLEGQHIFLILPTTITAITCVYTRKSIDATYGGGRGIHDVCLSPPTNLDSIDIIGKNGLIFLKYLQAL